MREGVRFSEQQPHEPESMMELPTPAFTPQDDVIPPTDEPVVAAEREAETPMMPEWHEDTTPIERRTRNQ
jgi:hypothetical protein